MIHVLPMDPKLALSVLWRLTINFYNFFTPNDLFYNLFKSKLNVWITLYTEMYLQYTPLIV